MSAFLIGVLGGMGPLATVDLMRKIIDETPAQRDQQHAPVVAWNVPQIADRQQALAGDGPSPLPALLQAVAGLNQAGASHIVMACNTAHHWYDALASSSRAPLLHIADATMDSLQPMPGERIGLIATQGTLDAGWYQRRIADYGAQTLTPLPEEMRTWFVPGCYAVKRGELQAGAERLAHLAEALTERGAQRLILACTEVPPAFAAIDSPWLSVSVDPTRALAKAAARLWLNYRQDLQL